MGFEFVYTAATLGAWTSMYGVEDLVNRTPKYGDIYLTRDKGGIVRHTGAIVEWRPDENWFGTADAGQGNMGSNDPKGGTADERAKKATQGMAYTIRKLRLNTDSRSYIVTPEGHQAGGEVYLAGFINMEIFIIKLKDYGNQVWGDDNKNKPTWI